MNEQSPAATQKCKICGSLAHLSFGLPRTKKSGHPIPDAPDDCWFYLCERCEFVFTPSLDGADHQAIYDDDYWTKQDPDWYGRVGETFRLVAVGSRLLRKPIEKLDILDYGCGSGGFVERARKQLSMNVWGTDINQPPLAREWFLKDLGDQKFDMIVACEVIEHLPDPRGVFETLKAHLKSPGVLAFQTGEWHPKHCDRNWWYLGPDNGHISHYSRKSLDYLFRKMKGSKRVLWNDYPGLQAWRFRRHWWS